jgi:hypothetical protein
MVSDLAMEHIYHIKQSIRARTVRLRQNFAHLHQEAKT